jgi:hypothetical protein
VSSSGPTTGMTPLRLDVGEQLLPKFPLHPA